MVNTTRNWLRPVVHPSISCRQNRPASYVLFHSSWRFQPADRWRSLLCGEYAYCVMKYSPSSEGRRLKPLLNKSSMYFCIFRILCLREMSHSRKKAHSACNALLSLLCVSYSFMSCYIVALSAYVIIKTSLLLNNNYLLLLLIHEINRGCSS